MTWTLFVRADCHDCDRARAWMDEQAIAYEVRDMDHLGSRPAKRLFIAPTLCRGTELMAYGVDIIGYVVRVPR